MSTNTDPFADIFNGDAAAPQPAPSTPANPEVAWAAGDSFHFTAIPGSEESPQPTATATAPAPGSESTGIETTPSNDPVTDPVTDVQVVSCDELPKLVPASGSWFVYDLETVPDESRNPRPGVQLPTDRPASGVALEALLGKAINTIKPALATLSLGELNELSALEQGGKNRATLLSAITEEIGMLTGCDTSELDEWRKLSFAPFGCRIVSCGIATRDRVYVVLCKTAADEVALLNHLWDLIDVNNYRVGYNIKGFDDAVILARTMILRLPVRDVVMDRNRYAKESVDLMQTLFPSGTPMKLKTLCQEIGIFPPAGYEMSGDQVLDLVDAGRWEDLALYSHSDATIERELYYRLRDYVTL